MPDASHIEQAEANLERAVSAWRRTLIDGAAYVGQLGAKHLDHIVELLVVQPGEPGATRIEAAPGAPTSFRGVLTKVEHVQQAGRPMTRLTLRAVGRTMTLDCTPNVEVKVEH